MDRALDSLRRQLDSSAVYAVQRQLDSSAVQAQRQLEASAALARQLEDSAVESVRRYLERQNLAFEALEARFNSPVADAILALDAQHAELRSHLQRAIAPLPDLSSWHHSVTGDYFKLPDTLVTFDTISRAVEQAALLWSSELPEFEPSDEDLSKEPSEKQPSEQLIRAAPVDALIRLKSVDFLPLRVLDRIYRAPKAVHQLTPRQFEQLVAEILDELGFHGIELTPRSGDRGRDVVALKQVNGIPIIFAFECKRQAPHRKVGVGIVRALLGTVNQISTRANVGVLVTTSTFTRGAQNFFLTEAAVKGRDFNGVVEWLEEIGRLRRNARPL